MMPAMEGLTLDEVARRAGSSTDFVEALVRHGVLQPSGERDAPFVPGDVRRTQLVAACADAGLSVEAIGEALRRGTLTLATLDLPYYDRWAGRSEATFGELASEFGLPFDLIQQTEEALGFAAPSPEDRPRDDAEGAFRALQIALTFGFDRDALVGLMRVYGDALRRIGRTESQLWHEYVEVPVERAGLGQREILEAGVAFGGQIMDVLDGNVLATYRRMQEAAWMEDLVEHIELGLEEAGLHRKLPRPPAMCFVDLVGYARLTEERGDEAAAELAARLAGLVQRSAARHGGRAVKWLGDGVMIQFADPGRGVQAALEVVDGVGPAGLPAAHVGMHAGPVVVRDGDVFGRTVNLASRISARAGPHEVLVSADVVEAARDAPAGFEPIGPVALKGVAEPVPLFHAVRA
jgi:adenylate cyclase